MSKLSQVLTGSLLLLLVLGGRDANAASYLIESGGTWETSSIWYEGEIPHNNYTYVSGGRTVTIADGDTGETDLLQIGLVSGSVGYGTFDLAGPGTIHILNQGTLYSYSTIIGEISVNSETGQVRTASGNLAIFGGEFGYSYLQCQTGSLNIAGGQVGGLYTWISYGGEHSSVTASVSNGASWGTGALYVGTGGGIGNLSISGVNTTVSSQSVEIGTGVVDIEDAAWTIDSNSFKVGAIVGGSTLNIKGGATVTSYGCKIGGSAAASGTVNVEGGTWNASDNLLVGASGTGTLNINGGDVTINAFVGIGSNSTVTITNGTLTSGTGMAVGGAGGTLNVNGGKVIANISGGLDVGSTSDGKETVNVTAGELKTRYLTVGKYGVSNNIAELNISGGTVTTDTNAIIGESGPSGGGTANLTGGSWDIGGNLILGYQGTGTLNVNGGAVSASNIYVGQWGTGILDISSGSINVSGQIVVAKEVGSHGTLNYNGGTLNASSIIIGSGSATVNFNQTGAMTAGFVLTGDLDLNVNNSGTTTLTTENTYTGKTSIKAGTLILAQEATINNSAEINLGTSGEQGILDVSAKSDFSIGSGQRLSGCGTVQLGEGKTLTIYGILSPGNSPGVTSVIGDSELDAISTTLMELAGIGGVAGVDFDQYQVSGLLTYGGNLSIQGFSGYDITQTAAYQLFDFAQDNGDFNSVTVGTTSLVLDSGIWAGSDGLANYTFSQASGIFTVASVPEPGAVALIGFSVIVMFLRRRQNRLQLKTEVGGSGSEH